MKNKHGVVRSAEFLRANPGQMAKAPGLHHIRVHPDGRVTHHSSPHSQPHATHSFSDHGALSEHLSEHMPFEERPQHAAEAEPEEM